ncbi:reverse transcriptase domain-containing protein [Tanacetum coccineum]
MAEEDEEKTTFITSQGVFCYSKMPFGLKNARATYQRLVDKAFQKQIGKNLKVYVDYLSDFQWTAEVEAAFKEMKKLIAKLPTLTAPMEKEELIVYLAATREAVSTVLMTEREAKQMPVYFVIRALQVQTKNISQRIDLGGFHSGTSRRRLSRHAHGNGGGTSRPIDAVHERIILFDATNNKAEYEALVAGLRIAVTPPDGAWTEYVSEGTKNISQRIDLGGFHSGTSEDDSLDTPMETERELSRTHGLCHEGSSCIDGSKLV